MAWRDRIELARAHAEANSANGKLDAYAVPPDGMAQRAPDSSMRGARAVLGSSTATGVAFHSRSSSRASRSSASTCATTSSAYVRGVLAGGLKNACSVAWPSTRRFFGVAGIVACANLHHGIGA